MCMAWLLSLFGCGKKKPHMLDGPGMERELWIAFTISRCNERFEIIYSYTVKYDDVSSKAHLYEGQDEENSIQLRNETIESLISLNLLSLPDEEPVTGNFLGLTVTDSNGQVYPKQISKATEEEILSLIDVYVSALHVGSEEEPFMLDGPGMEYTPAWTEFTLSRSDSHAQHNFSFTVTEGDTEPMVSGVCRDSDGNEYDVETGIVLTGDTLWTLRRMDLEQLQNVVETETWEELPQVLDGSDVTLSIVLTDGTVEKKHISAELSLEIYQQLLPYFINNKQ